MGTVFTYNNCIFSSKVISLMKLNYKLLLLMLLNVLLSFSQQTKVVDFKRGDVVLDIEPYSKTVKGVVTYHLDVLQKTDSIYIDAQNIEFFDVQWNGKKVKYKVTDNYLILYKRFKPKRENYISFEYKATPKKTMYFIGWDTEGGQKQIWTQGQGKYTSNWLPSFDDVNEKVIFNLLVNFDDAYQVVANGKLKGNKPLSLGSGNKKQWIYNMEKPMSSYLLAIAIGKYEKRVVNTASGLPMELYYYPDEPNKVEPTYRYSKEIFDFLEHEIGVSFPWVNYKQIPVKDFMYGGMENTTATIFNDSYYIDSLSFVDKNYVNVNAHELAHQWFGDFVTEATPEDHWLQEGFATYYALLAEKHIFGTAYFNAALYDTALQLKMQSDSGKGEALLNAKASSLTFYQKGAWALVTLRNLIGDSNFTKGIQSYLTQYGYTNVTTTNFLDAMEKASGINLDAYKKQWLLNTVFPYDEAMGLLNDNPYSLPELLSKTFKDSIAAIPDETHKTIWKNMSPRYKEKLIAYNKKAIVDSFYIKSILKDTNTRVKQAYLVQVDNIPIGLQSTFEKFLKEDSYITIESMLYKLWVLFPEKRAIYLQETADVIGFNDKNIRILWLALALATPDYETMKKGDFYEELTGYTSAVYGYDVREKAFMFLNELQAFSNENLKDLVNACLHHSWRFASSSRELLTQLAKDPDYNNRLNQILPELPEREQQFLKSKL